MEASKYGHTKIIVKLLLDAGADVNAQDKYGYTALTMALGEGNAETAKLLIGTGATFDVNAQDEYGLTALMQILNRILNRNPNNDKSLEIINFLLNNGADPTIRNNQGKTADDYLVRKMDEMARYHEGTAEDIARINEIRSLLTAAERRIEANREFGRNSDLEEIGI